MPLFLQTLSCWIISAFILPLYANQFKLIFNVNNSINDIKDVWNQSGYIRNVYLL